MVVTVQCPAAACRKYMMIEERERGRVVACLICRTKIVVPGSTSAAPVFDVPTLTPIDVPPQQGFIPDAEIEDLTDDELLGLD